MQQRHKADVSPPASQAPAPSQRKPYESPVLHVYGAVHTLTQAAGSGMQDGGSMMNSTTMTMSSVLTKTNIVRIGTHPWGFGLYLFDYLPHIVGIFGGQIGGQIGGQCRPGRQFGVLAEEVEAVVPFAVAINTAGYKMVDYAALGIHTV